VIIVEGPDGAGKTTLAEKIAAHLNVEYRRPPAEVLSSTAGPLSVGLPMWWDRQLQAPYQHAVYDRCFYVSDGIYRMISKKQPLIDEVVHARGLSALVAAQPLMIFCLPSFEQTLVSVHEPGRDKLTGYSDHDLYMIYWQYHIFSTLWKQIHFHDTLVYDWADKADILYEVKDYTRRYWGGTTRTD